MLIRQALNRVLEHGQFIMGPEVYELEKQLGAYCGVKQAISCSSGTDALWLSLMALDVKKDHAVFVPSFTFAATAEAVVLAGAMPVFVDSLETTYNLDPVSLEQAIFEAKKLGLAPKGVVAVDLFGQPADYDAIRAITQQHGLWLIADAAQSFGASYNAQLVGTLADVTTTSFFPTKPLGGYGDGGAVFTNSDRLASTIKSLRVHGQSDKPYEYQYVGINGRLDTIQAAVLLEKLAVFSETVQTRQNLAKAYDESLSTLVKTPKVISQATSVWAQYTVLLPEELDRSTVMDNLKNLGVTTRIYYPTPLHLQAAYRHFPRATGAGLATCEMLSNRVLSFPMNSSHDLTQLTQRDLDHCFSVI